MSKATRGVAADVDGVDDADAGVFAEDVHVALEALIEIGLAGHGEEDDVAMAVEGLDEGLAAEASELKIVGADEEEALGVGGVGVHGDDGDAGGDGGVNLGRHELGVGDGDEDAGGFFSDSGAEFLDLCGGVVSIGPHELAFDALFAGGFSEAGVGGLPVGQLDVGGDEDITF